MAKTGVKWGRGKWVTVSELKKGDVVILRPDEGASKRLGLEIIYVGETFANTKGKVITWGLGSMPYQLLEPISIVFRVDIEDKDMAVHPGDYYFAHIKKPSVA